MPFRSRTVLVVDDNSFVLELIVGMLEMLGCHVVSAESAFAALDLLDRGEPVDALLTDVSMPDMDGATLARRARARRPGLKVVYMSGSPVSELVPHAPLLRKPYDVLQLRAVLASVFAT